MKSERLGLVMILASLSAIALISGLFFYNQRADRLQQIRVQGISLARVMSNMPLARLAPAGNGVLDLVRSLQANTDFAYAVIENVQGAVLAHASAPGIIPPPGTISLEPASWFAQRAIAEPENNRVFQEFQAPVVDHGERVAQVRLGYLEPTLFAMDKRLSFLAMIALPVFLLTPIFYLLIKREIVPLMAASDQIKTMLDEQPSPTVELTASGVAGEFMNNFNRVVQAAEKRIVNLEQQADGMLTSAKILSYQKARIESTLQSLPDGIMIMDEKGVATYANAKIEMIMGVDAESIVDKRIHEWCGNDQVLELLSGIGGNAHRRMYGGNLEIQSETDPHKRYSVSAYPLFSPKDEANIWGAMVVFRDVSAESLARDARKEFVARLAHELKTPLHVIGMYTEMLRDDGAGEQISRIEAGNIIQDELERTNALIRNMLNIAEIEMGSVKITRTRTRMGDFLNDIYTNLERSSENGLVNCRIDCPREISAAYLDKELMRVAINNLMINAIKYNQPGGEVVLAAQETDEEYVISVRDNGIGISEADKARIFERFFRAGDETAKNRGGHGLGLSLAKEIVELHDGELRVASSLGEGSTFSIVLAKSVNSLKEAI